MAKNLIFGYLDHSKRHFLWILNDPAWAEVENCNGGNHLALRQNLKQQTKIETWKHMKQIRIYEEPKKNETHSGWTPYGTWGPCYILQSCETDCHIIL